MNELKPEDVMRALELCKSCRDLQPCDVCPYFRAELGDDESCVNRMAQDALALLREKDAEIERLKAAAEEAVRSFTRLETLYNLKCKQLETTRAEAITAFVDGCVKMAIGLGGIPVVCLESIFQFAKKMKEEKDGESDL